MNLLDISRSEDGALIPHIATVDLARMVEDLRGLQCAHNNRHRLEIESVAATVEADGELLRRLIENLLDNARKYSPPESIVRLVIEPLEDGWIEIRVYDQGSGVPADHRERIFDKYARLESADEQAASSRGLGLTFCRLAAEVHGGRIWVDENKPQGSCFHVRLPVTHRRAI